VFCKVFLETEGAGESDGVVVLVTATEGPLASVAFDANVKHKPAILSTTSGLSSMLAASDSNLIHFSNMERV
jgi:hypothetical protein